MGRLALIAALPLLGFLVNGLFGARLPKRLVEKVNEKLKEVSAGQ